MIRNGLFVHQLAVLAESEERLAHNLGNVIYHAYHSLKGVSSMIKQVCRAQKHDTNAFTELMLLCERDMYRIARSILQSDVDIADAMQETILACFENLSTLRTPAFFKTWLIRILINKCNDILRSERKTVTMDVLPESGYTDPALANVEFEMLMDSLDEPYRTVLVLRYGEGLSTRQISQLLDISESAVRQRLKRGREKARDLFETEKPVGMEVLA